VKWVVSLHRNMGITPLIPMKAAQKNIMMTNIATFSLHACLASFFRFVASSLASMDMPFVILTPLPIQKRQKSGSRRVHMRANARHIVVMHPPSSSLTTFRSGMCVISILSLE
jgi:hypothetical protein